jgi:3-deoxy-D-manno-octulosonic-acid transferase
MTGLLLNLCYLLLLAAVLPMLAWKWWRHGKYRTGWDEKWRGRLPERTDFDQPLIWLHAVSVGEVLQLRPLVERLRQERGELRFLVTTTTETGYAVAQEQLSSCTVAYFPLDFTWSVRQALDRVRPDLLVLVELELWPNLIREAARRRIPLMLINGRLSQQSFQGYSRVRPLVSALLRSFSTIAVQTPEYRDRFLKLGAPGVRTVVTGSIKFDGVETDRDNPRTRELRAWMNLREDEPVWIAGSTQEPEEALVLRVYRSLLDEFPELRLILVPRHPERGHDVAELIREAGWSVRRRSLKTSGDEAAGHAVGLLDTVGELGACWGLADVAFVGGSFGDRGGQNMLEPAAYGAVVCFGPNTRNFRREVELLTSRDAARTVSSEEELRFFVAEMLRSPEAAWKMGQQARRLVLSQQGATDRTIRLIGEVLDPSGGKSAISRAA